MPIYEFVCATCGEPFEDLVKSYAAIAEVRCPHCGSGTLRRKISIFASRVSNAGTAGAVPACTGGGT